VGERGEGNVRFHDAVMARDEMAGVGGLADHREVELPFLEDAFGDGLGAGLQHHQHAFLAFRQQHLIGGHGVLADGHEIEVEVDTDPAFVCHLNRGRGEPGGAHVLNGDDGVFRHELQAGFQQELLGERVAHLHGGPFLLRRVVELRGRHGGAVNAVAAGLGAHIDHGEADALRGGLEDAASVHDPNAHGVDQNVVVVASIEIRLAADRGHAHAVAVVPDAGDDAGHQVPRLGMVGCAETQRVQIGDGPGAHRKDIAHNAADAGRRTLIGLDVRGVVVALHLEDGSLAVPEIDHAGILAGPLQDLRA